MNHYSTYKKTELEEILYKMVKKMGTDIFIQSLCYQWSRDEIWDVIEYLDEYVFENEFLDNSVSLSRIDDDLDAWEVNN
jgi:hypothetical protein